MHRLIRFLDPFIKHPVLLLIDQVRKSEQLHYIPLIHINPVQSGRIIPLLLIYCWYNNNIKIIHSQMFNSHDVPQDSLFWRVKIEILPFWCGQRMTGDSRCWGVSTFTFWLLKTHLDWCFLNRLIDVNLSPWGLCAINEMQIFVFDTE